MSWPEIICSPHIINLGSLHYQASRRLRALLSVWESEKSENALSWTCLLSENVDTFTDVCLVWPSPPRPFPSGKSSLAFVSWDPLPFGIFKTFHGGTTQRSWLITGIMVVVLFCLFMVGAWHSMPACVTAAHQKTATEQCHKMRQPAMLSMWWVLTFNFEEK